jgi:hypothetical protein
VASNNSTNVWRRRAATTLEWVAVAGDVTAGFATLTGATHWSAIATIAAVSARAVAEAVAPPPDDPQQPGHD